MILATATLLFGCDLHAPASPRDNRPATRPIRIISLDYCADQFVLKLVDRDRILAVSPDAEADYSYMRAAAVGVPNVRPLAEDALILKPDLIVRSYGGGPNAAAYFERAGIPVLNVGWAGDIEGVKRVISEMAEGLGESDRGGAVIAEMDARLASINLNSRSPTALYVTPTGVTSGPGSLIHEMILAANLENYQAAPGWRSLPLERLAYEQPDLVATAFFDSRVSHMDAWSAMAHPIARAQMKNRPTVPLDPAWTVCGGWFLVDAVEALAMKAAEEFSDE